MKVRAVQVETDKGRCTGSFNCCSASSTHSCGRYGGRNVACFIMPLKGDKNGSKKSVDYKARLDRKLYLAQESPEPIFDLSVCNLKVIPNNVFPLCRVLRKEALYLQNNNLTNLATGGNLADLKNLKILNLSANKFIKLPSNINELENLEVLDVSNNEIVGLPETIGGLSNLRSLNLSYNNLNQLPMQIGYCGKMEVLKLSYNENLSKLPVTLAKLPCLVQLDIDPTVTYPPRDICKQGVDEIKKFLSRELKYVDYVDVPSTSDKTSAKTKTLVPHFDSLQEKIELYEKMKQEKQNERMLLEKQLMDQNQKELEIQQKLKGDKQKLIDNMKNQQEYLEAELLKLQERKNIDRALLIKLCQDEETKSNNVVNKILNIKRDLQMKFTKEWENERIAEEKMLLSHSNQSKALERKKILISMEELMAEEFFKSQKIIAERKSFVVRSLASEVSKQNDALLSLIEHRDRGKTFLLDTLKQDEELQKSAVASLLEKSDATSWELAQQIRIIEEQLAELTRLEVAKKKLESESHMTELSKNRIALTELLMDLLERQTERRNQLVETIRRMEMMKTSIRDSELFWMQQFDKLLRSKGHEMVNFLESINQKLVYELYINGVFHYLPLLRDVLLSQDEMKNLDDATLAKHGIQSADDRSRILGAINSFLETNSYRIVPGAPALEEPSAPLEENVEFVQPTSYIIPDECVICLEMKPSIIFVPCGHLCCCYSCSKSVTLCPLCRKPIDASLERTE